MNARNQLLVVLTALMLVCSSGAMVVGAAPAATVDEHNSTDENGDVVPDEDANATADEEPDTVADGEEGDEDADPSNETTSAEDNETVDEDADQDATVTFSEQTTEGETVVVDEVTMASGGFVTIHDSSLLVGDAFESVIGTSEYLEEGTHENVEVSLDEPLEEDETLIAMPHRDTNDNEEYDFVETEGEEDIPYLTADDEPVTDDAVVTIGESAEEPVDEEQESVGEGPDDEASEDVEDGQIEGPSDETPEDEPAEEPNDEATQDEPTEDPADEEPNATEDGQAEEPVNDSPEDVEEGPVEEPGEEDPVEDPADEEPEATEDDEINVVIERATIFVLVDEMPDDGMPTEENDVGVDANNGEVNEDDINATDDDDVVVNGDDVNGELEDGDEFETGDVDVNVTIEQATIVPILSTDALEEEPAEGNATGLETNSNEESAVNMQDDEAPADTEDGEHEIVIERVSFLVLLENVDGTAEDAVDGADDLGEDSDEADVNGVDNESVETDSGDTDGNGLEADPAEEESEAPEDDASDISIERATVFVVVGGLADDVSAAADDAGVDASGDGVDDGETNASEVETNGDADAANADETDANDGSEDTDLEDAGVRVTVTIDQVTIAPVGGHHDAETGNGMNGVNEPAAENATDPEAGPAADEPANEHDDGAPGAVDGDALEVVIEQATVFVIFEDVDAEGPVEEDPGTADGEDEPENGVDADVDDADNATGAQPALSVAGAH